MTRYDTETEAESYEAAHIAHIALDAAMEAVDRYQRRHGVCDAPFRCTLHVDNGDEADREVSAPRQGPIMSHNRSVDSPAPPGSTVEAFFYDGYVNMANEKSINWSHVDWYRVVEADREGTFPPITTKEEAREVGRDALRRAGEAHDRYTGRDGWIRHEGGECPVHPMDVVQIMQGTDDILENKHGVPASYFRWNPVTHYRPLRDEDGVPYCSAEGLEDWAEYVATDDDESVWQYSYKPIKCDCHWDCGPPGRRNECETPAMFANTRDHWTQTLRRVYRREDT